jgi:hypothetical protein
MTTQQQLDLFAPPAQPGEVEQLCTYLYNRGPQWTTAKRIEADLGINDRKLRILKAASNRRIVSAPGSPGYRHLAHCTIDQINESAARLKSQIRHMTSDWIALKQSARERLLGIRHQP